jgi:hypothetical protein
LFSYSFPLWHSLSSLQVFRSYIHQSSRPTQSQIIFDFPTVIYDIQNKTFVRSIHHHTPVFRSFKTAAKCRQIYQWLSEHVSQYWESRNQQRPKQCEFSLSLLIVVISPHIILSWAFPPEPNWSQLFFEIALIPTNYSASRGQGISNSNFLTIFLVLDMMLLRASLLEVGRDDIWPSHRGKNDRDRHWLYINGRSKYTAQQYSFRLMKRTRLFDGYWDMWHGTDRISELLSEWLRIKTYDITREWRFECQSKASSKQLELLEMISDLWSVLIHSHQALPHLWREKPFQCPSLDAAAAYRSDGWFRCARVSRRSW